MKRLLIIATIALCGTLSGQIETRPVTFAANEIPATNPRVEKSGDMTTHIELFAPFVENGDGSVSTTVAESAITMDAMSVASWLKEARAALGLTVRTFSKRKCVVALKREGVWEQVKAWIVAADLYDEYLAAQDFKEDDHDFVAGKAALKAQLGWTDEKVESVLATCILEK